MTLGIPARVSAPGALSALARLLGLRLLPRFPLLVVEVWSWVSGSCQFSFPRPLGRTGHSEAGVLCLKPDRRWEWPQGV